MMKPTSRGQWQIVFWLCHNGTSTKGGGCPPCPWTHQTHPQSIWNLKKHERRARKRKREKRSEENRRGGKRREGKRKCCNFDIKWDCGLLLCHLTCYWSIPCATSSNVFWLTIRSRIVDFFDNLPILLMSSIYDKHWYRHNRKLGMRQYENFMSEFSCPKKNVIDDMTKQTGITLKNKW